MPLLSSNWGILAKAGRNICTVSERDTLNASTNPRVMAVLPTSAQPAMISPNSIALQNYCRWVSASHKVWCTTHWLSSAPVCSHTTVTNALHKHCEKQQELPACRRRRRSTTLAKKKVCTEKRRCPAPGESIICSITTSCNTVIAAIWCQQLQPFAQKFAELHPLLKVFLPHESEKPHFVEDVWLVLVSIEKFYRIRPKQLSFRSLGMMPIQTFQLSSKITLQTKASSLVRSQRTFFRFQSSDHWTRRIRYLLLHWQEMCNSRGQRNSHWIYFIFETKWH